MRSLALMVLGVIILALTHKSFSESSDLKPRIFPPKFTVHTSLGYQDIIADALWIRAIQDFGFCEGPRQEKAVNLGVTYDQALANVNVPSRCDKGWLYQMLDVVTDLAPRFKVPFKAGAVELSVGVDDREGARLLFEKSLKQFPEDWTVAYAASYHYLFEIQDAARAADLLMQASRYGGPTWLPTLASKLYSASGRQELGRSVIEEYLRTNPDPKSEGAIRARKRLGELNSLKQ